MRLRACRTSRGKRPATRTTREQRARRRRSSRSSAGRTNVAMARARGRARSGRGDGSGLSSRPLGLGSVPRRSARVAAANRISVNLASQPSPRGDCATNPTSISSWYREGEVAHSAARDAVGRGVKGELPSDSRDAEPHEVAGDDGRLHRRRWRRTTETTIASRSGEYSKQTSPRFARPARVRALRRRTSRRTRLRRVR